jgi:DNA-binding MarR family transcriptional regulator
MHDEACREMARDCLALRARRLERTLTRLYDEELAGHDVTASQLSMLAAITLLGGATAARLGRVLDLEKSTVSRNVSRLVEAGLVDSSGGLRVTARGAAAFRAGHVAWRRAQRRARAALGPRTLKLLEALSTEGSP